MRTRRPKKSERDRLSENSKLLTNLLLHEASGGIIPLPKGAEGYKPPPIPFPERRALIDSVNKQLMVDLKIDPDSEESGFDLLKEELSERNRKRNGNQTRSGGISSSPNRAYDSDGDSDNTFAGGSA